MPFSCILSQVQLLHCIKQAKSEGGDNQFCDGFHIAERMRTEQPENFKLLTEVLIDHYDLGEESTGQRFFKLQRQPVIRCVSLYYICRSCADMITWPHGDNYHLGDHVVINQLKH